MTSVQKNDDHQCSIWYMTIPPLTGARMLRHLKRPCCKLFALPHRTWVHATFFYFQIFRKCFLGSEYTSSCYLTTVYTSVSNRHQKKASCISRLGKTITKMFWGNGEEYLGALKYFFYTSAFQKSIRKDKTFAVPRIERKVYISYNAIKWWWSIPCSTQ